MDLNVLGKQLEEFLREQGEPADLAVTDLAPIPGGYSLVTVGFTVTTSDGSRRYVLRLNPPEDAALARTDRRQEWELLSGLTARSEVPMPAARWFDDGTHLGRPGIVLDFIDGPQLGAHAAAGDDGQRRRLALQMAETLAAVHAHGAETVPTGQPRPESWDVYVDGFIAAWREVEATHAERNPFIRYVAAWLEAHKPPPASLTLTHGEFQTGNVMLDTAGRMQVIDWEFAHIGDPRIDLGWCQNVAAFSPPDLIGLDPVAFCSRYCEVSGLSPEVVNPLTVGYFAILSGAKAFGAMLAGVSAMARGENHLITSAYLVSAESFVHRLWLGGTRQIEAAMAAMAAQPGARGAPEDMEANR